MLQQMQSGGSITVVASADEGARALFSAELREFDAVFLPSSPLALSAAVLAFEMLVFDDCDLIG